MVQNVLENLSAGFHKGSVHMKQYGGYSLSGGARRRSTPQEECLSEGDIAPPGPLREATERQSHRQHTQWREQKKIEKTKRNKTNHKPMTDQPKQ